MRYNRKVLPVISALILLALGGPARTNSYTSQEQDNARKFDAYGDVGFNDEKARLDNFVIQLQNEPSSQGFIVVYGGRRCPSRAQTRADRARQYVVNTRGVDPGRVVAIDAGRREELTIELWIVPMGKNLPAATPTLAPCRSRPR